MKGANHPNQRQGTPTEEAAFDAAMRDAFSAPYTPRVDPATGYDVRDASEEARAAHVKAMIAALKI